MATHLPKLLLPTVSTCPHRLPSPGTDGADGARCQLVASLLAVEDAAWSRVDRGARTACCETFPPTAEQLNPVVASLVFRAASGLLQDSGTSSSVRQQAQVWKDRSRQWLDLSPLADSRLTPARRMESCWYFVAGDPSAPVERPGAVPEDEAVHACRHAEHRVTTRGNCRACRDWIMHKPVSRLMTLEELLPGRTPRSGAPVKRWAVGITTAPRRQATLEWCLDSVVRAGWDSAHLFLDGTARIPERYRHLPVTWRERKIGPWPAYCLALTELLLQVPDADAYLMLQDDAYLHDRHNLREYFEGILWPGETPGIVVPYFPGTVEKFGWHGHVGDWGWGAVAFLFPRDVARAMVSEPAICRSRWTEGEHRQSIEAYMGEWARRHGVEIWFPYPSLVQHLGNSSTIWRDTPNRGPRRAKCFTGSLETPLAVEESLDAFPEEQFPCPAELRGAYERTVEAGLRRMRASSVVLCGLSRNVRHFLPRIASRVERLGGMFREYQVVVFENDSRDATREFLTDWQRVNPRVHALTKQLGLPGYPSIRSLRRVAQLAEFRNRYRDYAVRRFGTYDFVIVLDTDLAGGWSYEGIAHTFGCEDWDFIGSYGLTDRIAPKPDEWPYVHYDTWAFRPSERTPIDPREHPADLMLRRGQPLLPVRSCFGGLGVYRMECLRRCRYGVGDIEHVVLHEEMRRLGFDRLYLNPSQVVLYMPA